MARTGRPRLPIGERLENYSMPVTETGCWLWTGSRISKMGYGQMVDKNSGTSQAHRVSYEYYIGPIPSGMCVCHKCDVPCCINPAHLFLGTHLDNVRDMIAKGRNEPLLRRHRGSSSRYSKLTDEQVLKIRDDRRLQRVIASEYGVNRTAISRIKSRVRWKHL